MEEDVQSYRRGQFRLHREVPFYFVKLKEGWADPKPRIMADWSRKS